MKKISMVISTALTVSLCLNVVQYCSYKKEHSSKSDTEQTYFLKEIPSLYIHSSIDGVYDEWFSATGTSADINPYCINNNGGVTVLDRGDEHFTKISVEGYIPTWYITENEPHINYKNL